MAAVETLAPEVGTKQACMALEMPRASLYRKRGKAKSPAEPSMQRPAPKRALSPKERLETLDILHSQRFVDKAPCQVYADLLDERRYLCSIRTMYRIFDENGEVKERRNQVRRPVYAKPELLAEAPNQVWSRDITKLKGPQKWNYFYLYVILDIFSRYVVGWMAAPRESATLAERLIKATCKKQGIERGQLGLHADRGSSMRSKAVALLLADLGVTENPQPPVYEQRRQPVFGSSVQDVEI